MKSEEKFKTEKFNLKESVDTSTTDAANDQLSGATAVNSTDEPRKDDFPDLGDDYKVLQVLGCGGMSTVYKARNVGTGSTVAIKVISALLAKDKATLKRFENESKALIELDDSELLNIFGSGFTADGAPYLVMEFIEGESLAEVLAKERVDSKRALSLSIDICRLLSRAHKQGIIHRDIKPSNIMVTNLATGDSDKPIQDLGEIEQVRIVDFGIARMVDGTAGNTTSLTQTGAIFGTPTYMSPEQCKPNQEVDNRADIYSFGCLMYELLTGKPPFSGDNPVQVAIQHLNDPPDQFSKNTKDKFIKRLEPIVLRCLEKEKQDRYQSTDQLLKDLERVQSGGKASAIWNPLKNKPKKAPGPTEMNEHEVSGLMCVFMLSLVSIAIGVSMLTGVNLKDSDVFPKSTKIGVDAFFCAYSLMAMIYLLRFLMRQIRFLRTNGWKMKTKEFWTMQTVTVACMYTGSSFALFILMLFATIKNVESSLPFTLVTSIVSTIYLALVLLFPITFLHGLIPKALERRLKWLNQTITIKQAMLQLQSVILFGISAFVIACLSCPTVAAGVPGYLAVAAAPTEAKLFARNLCEINMRMNPTDDFAPIAITQIDFRLKEYDKPLPILDKAIANNPDNAPLKYVRAQVNEKLHNITASFEDINTVIALQKTEMKQEELQKKDKQKDKSVESRKSDDHLRLSVSVSMVDTLGLRAKLYLDEHRYDDAIKDYTEALKIYPKNGECFRNRASAYLAKKEYKQATDDLFKALISDADELDYLRLASVYELQGNLESAHEYYTLTTKNVLEPMARAVAFKKLGKMDEYEKIINPDDKPFGHDNPMTKTELANELFSKDLRIPLKWD